MNDAELFKLAMNLDEDVKPSDFCVPEENDVENITEEMVELKESEVNNKINQKTQKYNKNSKNPNKNSSVANKNADFKNKYFAYYDDIKISSSDIEW